MCCIIKKLKWNSSLSPDYTLKLDSILNDKYVAIMNCIDNAINDIQLILDELETEFNN